MGRRGRRLFPLNKTTGFATQISCLGRRNQHSSWERRTDTKMQHWGGLAVPNPPCDPTESTLPTATSECHSQMFPKIDCGVSSRHRAPLSQTQSSHTCTLSTLDAFNFSLPTKSRTVAFHTPAHPAPSLKKRDDIAERVCSATQQSQDKLQPLSPKPDLFLGELICRSGFSFKQRPEEFSWRLLRLDREDLRAPNASLPMRKTMFHLVSNFSCKMLGPTTSNKFHSPSLCLSDLSPSVNHLIMWKQKYKTVTV